MKVYIHTLGCKVNQYESMAIMDMLIKDGYTRAQGLSDCDIAVLNSCTVTASSDAGVRKHLRKFRRERPGAVIVLTGCMPQAFPEIAAGFPEADVITGTKNRARISDNIMEYLSTKQQVVNIAVYSNDDKFEDLQASGFEGRTRAFLKIEDGCNRFCTYCIIPTARGRVRSKAIEKIIEETMLLSKNGYREIVLTGINLPAYGQDIGLGLCDAVEAVCAQNGIDRVRLGSLEPERLTQDVIDRFAAQEKLCPQFHLSLQSGCDKTLKKMNRHYTSQEYAEIVEDLRSSFADCAVTTDVMVGFPGETDEDFEKSLEFVKSIGFAKVHVFAYSKRPGTAAAEYEGQISNAVKEKRSAAMIEATEESRREFFKCQIGTTQQVLVERDRGNGIYAGYTKNYTPVKLHSGKVLTGNIVDVTIGEEHDDYCFGVIS